ncbi:MAG: hypothetical protein Q8N99_05980 [Nanoarchaeota archaeon]|nr:hypothetical protein [Nanoarchaeota archaeon]
MKKWLKILLIIFLIIIILTIIAGTYFYKFHVYKTLKICISNEKLDTKIPCANDSECYDLFMQNIPGLKNMSEASPSFMRSNIEESLRLSILCETTCQMKQIRGAGFGQEKDIELESCNQTEKEIAQKIRGKEIIQIYKFLKANNITLSELKI